MAEELPGLSTALDGAAMAERIQGALLAHSPRAPVEHCRPRDAVYVPGTGCRLRYEVGVAGDEAPTRLVNAYLFPSPAGGRRYARERLAPLAERVRDRSEQRPFATPVALVEELNMCLAAFPIDGELPTLVDATDPERAGEVVRRALPADGRPLPRTRVRVVLGRYRRRRCTLRYEVDGEGSSGGRTLFGKVEAGGRGARTAAAITALRARLGDREAAPFRVHEAFGFDRELDLLLLDAAPGTPQLSRALKVAAHGARRERSAIRDGVRACAQVAAALHALGVPIGPARPDVAELANLRALLAPVRRITPQLGGWLTVALAEADARMTRTHAQPMCTCHGDFKHSQVLFDGEQRWLLDFDTVCQAESALDLGQFLACLRLTAATARSELGDELCNHFLDSYIATVGAAELEERRMRARGAAYELVSLLRLAIHSWQKFKPNRLATLIALIDERLSCPAA